MLRVPGWQVQRRAHDDVCVLRAGVLSESNWIQHVPAVWRGSIPVLEWPHILCKLSRGKAQRNQERVQIRPRRSSQNLPKQLFFMSEREDCKNKWDSKMHCMWRREVFQHTCRCRELHLLPCWQIQFCCWRQCRIPRTRRWHLHRVQHWPLSAKKRDDFLLCVPCWLVFCSERLAQWRLPPVPGRKIPGRRWLIVVCSVQSISVPGSKRTLVMLILRGWESCIRGSRQLRRLRSRSIPGVWELQLGLFRVRSRVLPRECGPDLMSGLPRGEVRLRARSCKVPQLPEGQVPPR